MLQRVNFDVEMQCVLRPFSAFPLDEVCVLYSMCACI